MTIVVVERSLEGLEALEEMAERDTLHHACFEERDVKRLRSFVSQDHRRSICVYEAPDAGSVRDANERAGLPFDRVWTASEDIAPP